MGAMQYFENRQLLQREQAVVTGDDSASSALVASLAEQTLSVAVAGCASAFVLRGTDVVASAVVNKDAGKNSADLAIQLRAGDAVGLIAHHIDMEEQTVLALAEAKETAPNGEDALWLRCIPVDSNETWAPLGETPGTAEEPHPSWVRTIFNE